MQTMVQSAPISIVTIWTGRIMSALVVAFMVFDGGIQVMAFDFVTKGMAEFGIPGEFARPLGVVTLICTALYAVPLTSVRSVVLNHVVPQPQAYQRGSGAILLTGFLGGTIATHLPGADPLLPHIVSALVIASFVWGGLWLRDSRLRAMVPLLRA